MPRFFAVFLVAGTIAVAAVATAGTAVIAAAALSATVAGGTAVAAAITGATIAAAAVLTGTAAHRIVHTGQHIAHVGIVVHRGVGDVAVKGRHRYHRTGLGIRGSGSSGCGSSCLRCIGHAAGTQREGKDKYKTKCQKLFHG